MKNRGTLEQAALHVRVGLEDAPWGGALTNRQWVEQAARLPAQKTCARISL